MTWPLVTVCVATNRPHFAEWLSFNFAQLDYPNKALSVVCDYDAKVLRDVLGGGVRVTHAAECLSDDAPRTAGALFDAAMRQASYRTDFFAFRSDDSWWHPKSLRWLVEAYKAAAPSTQELQPGGPPCIGYSSGWFVRLEDEMCQLFQTAVPIVATSIYRTQAREVRWGHEQKASDTTWQNAVARRFGPGLIAKTPTAGVHHLWLCHGENTNAREYKFPTPLKKAVHGLEPALALALSVELGGLRARTAAHERTAAQATP
jgi:hypothetical protein